jgi:hypothetical protein
MEADHGFGSFSPFGSAEDADVNPQPSEPDEAPPAPEAAPAVTTLEEDRAEPTPAEASAQRPAEPGVSAETIDLTNRFLTDEIQGILSAAEESAARIVERARATTQSQIGQSNRLWREVQAEVARFASWRDQVEPVIRQVHSKVDSVRDLVDDVPERIRQALPPMADAISSIDADMSELASALTPPLLLTPSGLEAEEQGWLSRAGQTEPDAGEAPEDRSTASNEGEVAPGPFGAEAG